MLFDIADELRRVVRLGVAVGVLSFGQEHHFDVESLFEEHVNTPQCGVNACGIAIVKNGNVGSETLNEPYLRFGECRSSAGNNVLDAGLIHGDDVHLAFDEVTAVRTRDRLFGLEETVQFVRLGIDERVGRVDIFADVVFLLEDTSGEGNGLAADGEDREHDAVAEPVVYTSVFGLAYHSDANPGVHVIEIKLLFESFFLECCGERIAMFGRVAELVFANDIVAESPFAEITESDSLPFGCFPELLLEPLVGKIIDDEHGLSVVLALLLFGGHFALFDLDVVFFAELFDRFDERALLDLHDELKSMSGGSAAEALVDSFGRADGERAGLLVVERTETNEVRTAFAQCDIIGYHLFNLGSGVDSFYGLAGNQNIYDLVIYHLPFLFFVPEVDTEADVPLVETSAGVTVRVGELGTLVGIENTEIISSAEEITLVLESCSHAPRDIEV